MSALAALEEARRVTGPARLAGLRDAAEAIAESVRGTSVRSATLIEIDRTLVETQLVLPDARLISPFAVLTRRALSIVAADGTRVLIDPSDPGAGTPYEERLAARHPVLARTFAREREAPTFGAADVIFSTTLALRCVKEAARAMQGTRWLLMREEHEAACAPTPRDLARYARAQPSFELIDEGIALAEGVLVIPTPGMSLGHASVVFAVRGRVHLLSHAGVAQDAWSPYESKIPGLREAVRLRNVEAIVRGDASDPTAAIESMSIERALADREADAPAFLRIVPSASLTTALIAPRLRPFQGAALS